MIGNKLEVCGQCKQWELFSSDVSIPDLGRDGYCSWAKENKQFPLR